MPALDQAPADEEAESAAAVAAVRVAPLLLWAHSTDQVGSAQGTRQNRAAKVYLRWQSRSCAAATRVRTRQGRHEQRSEPPC